MIEIKLNDIILFEGDLYKVVNREHTYKNDIKKNRVALNQLSKEELTEMYLSKLARGELARNGTK